MKTQSGQAPPAEQNPGPRLGIPVAGGEPAGSHGIAQAHGTGAAAAHGVSAAELRHVETELAGYIGPLARHLVKRAASRANDLEELVAGLASELDVEADQRNFMERCRQGRGSV